MIGFNHLGRLGRFGNQMFQYAALRGIAANNQTNFCLPIYRDAMNDGVGNMNKTELFDCFKMETVSELNIQAIDYSRPFVTEESFNFNPVVFNNCPDWITLYGFFQTEKYFKNVEQTIRKDFQFKDEIQQPCDDMMQGILEEGQVVGLHIRRKDYLTNPNHHFVGIDYYEKALSMFPDSTNVLVFSDDSEWCHQQKLFEDDRFMISDNDSGYVDMCLMSMCTDFIIANSSFSWWAAWLGNKGKVVAPSNWFPDDKDTSDLYCPDWEVI
jgi:hypothetical protein|tara:strand:+ start:67 stop:870 length:804 start_codon:yes stop_codon:yes gene_type:complete